MLVLSGSGSPVEPALRVGAQWFRRGILEKAELFEIRNTLLEES